MEMFSRSFLHKSFFWREYPGSLVFLSLQLQKRLIRLYKASYWKTFVTQIKLLCQSISLFHETGPSSCSICQRVCLLLFYAKWSSSLVGSRVGQAEWGGGGGRNNSREEALALRVEGWSSAELLCGWYSNLCVCLLANESTLDLCFKPGHSAVTNPCRMGKLHHIQNFE